MMSRISVRRFGQEPKPRSNFGVGIGVETFQNFLVISNFFVEYEYL